MTPGITKEDLRGFFKNFREESDRACAILGRALLEETISKLFEAHFVAGTQAKDILAGQAPLATFSARIRVAAALGWISSDEASDLVRIKDIGNAFAHGLDHLMTFDQATIRDRVMLLESPQLLLLSNDLVDKPLDAGELEDLRARPRRRFELSVGILWSSLSRRADATTPAAPLKSLLMMLRDLTKESA